MKFNIALIASLALAASVVAQEAPAAEAPAADSVEAVAAAPAQEAFRAPQDQAATPTSAFEQDLDNDDNEDDDQSALWGGKKHRHKHHKHHKHHHKHHKHHKHHHHKHHHKDRCCIKYVTITSVPECKPTGSLPQALAGADAGAILEAWNPPPPAPAW
ncbi:hypothetical protein EC991_009127 [Linnemannia zychae]|nr:hypothetical protein EC991_009127 [Linnemannia zychae]